MKRIIFVVTMLASMILSLTTQAQSSTPQSSCYWVMLTDKNGTTFDPYTYFDSKAIERYLINDADLYDISNYPLNTNYVSQVNALATEEVGQSRWLNAAAVMATPEQITAIKQLPFVKDVVLLESNLHLSNHSEDNSSTVQQFNSSTVQPSIHNQLVRMGGNYFRAKGINGKGVRVAIFDGGFPQVNTHEAFKHLRDNHQIIKTWNFPNKKENVYRWNSHGLMTFSCIAGREGDTDLGLATGAEFLLARTEVEAEPFKEEVWWQMAMEWADKNGAQIISSSLGYGKDRYYTRDMNGESYVAKAGNMAARKGILVCNSAGNEGDDKSWYTIITPSDADSVLCVGGINPSLDYYQRTSFSSYGPSADGRQKPNVTAFAYAQTANTGKSNNNYHIVPGTSFSCPLVAGFAACALQCRPGIKAMDLFHEIEKSADLYPYCDYTYGYGVPQADYFTGDRNETKPTFRFEKVAESGAVRIVPLSDNDNCRMFIKNSLNNGRIIDYRKWELDSFCPGMWIEIDAGTVLTVNLDGYTESYTFSSPAISDGEMTATLYQDENTASPLLASLNDNQHFSTRINEKSGHWEPFLMLGLAIKTDDGELANNFWSPSKHFGVRYTHHFCKAYGWGIALDYVHTGFRFEKDETNRLDTLAGMADNVVWLDKNVSKHRVNLGEFGLEVYQRIRFVPGGIFHKGWHWDLGVYGSCGFNVYKLSGTHKGDVANTRKEVVRGLDVLGDYTWNWGVTTRISRDWLGIYARYRMNGIGKDVAADKILLPRLEVGLNLAF